MAMLYTLADGTQVKLPEGLSDEQVDNAILKALPEKSSLFGRVYDIEKDFNIRDGVPDLGIRWGQALARGNPKEIKAELDDQVGEGNWGMTEEGSLYITPAGLRQRGIEPKDERNVFVDGTDNGFYDLVDIAPEIAAGTASVIGEAGLIAATAGTGLLAQLAIGAAGAAAGDVAANIGLEGIQALRGTNKESPIEIFERIGTEGAAVLGTTLALGLPIAGVGKLAGKIKQSANSYAGKTMKDMQPVNKDSIKLAREEAKADFIAAGLKEKVADDLVPYATLKEMLGDQNTLATRMVTVLEGAGARSMGDALPARAVEFLRKYDDLVKSKLYVNPNIPKEELYQSIKNSLTKTEQKLVQDTVKQIDNFYVKHGAKIDEVMEVTQLTDLIAGNINRALKAGIEKFKSPSLYGTDQIPNPKLNLGGLVEQKIDAQNVADLLNKMADDLGTTAEAAAGRLTTLSDNSKVVGRLTRAVKFDETGKAVRRPKNEMREAFDFEKAKDRPIATFEGQREFVEPNAQDLYVVQQNLRRGMSGNLTRQQMREAVILSNGVTDALSSRLGKEFSQELARVNKEYKKFISPFNQKSLRYLTDTSEQSVEGFTKNIITGKKTNITFGSIVEDLDSVLRGTEILGGRASGVATADEILGTVATQYARDTRLKFGLDDLTKPLPELQQSARDALAQIRLFEKTARSQKFKKAYNKLFDNDAYQKYKTALRKIESGNVAGVDELGEMLTFKEAREFVDRTAKLASNLSGSDLRQAVQELRRHKKIDPEGGKFYSQMLYGEIMSRIASISTAPIDQQMPKMRAWSSDIIDAYTQSPKEFMELLKEASDAEIGQAGKSVLRMAEIIRGASNYDPSAGSISAASIPMRVFQLGMRGSFFAMTKPLTMMYGMKSFGPGGQAWKAAYKGMVDGVDIDKIELKMKPSAEKAIKTARKAADAALSGRNGLLAASVSAYMNEQGDYNVIKPGVKPRFVRYNEQNPPPQQQQQAPAPDLAMQQQELGANIMNMLQSASRLPPMGNIGQSGLKEGAAIARAR